MQASSSTAPPKVLNDLFEVVSYNGGAQEGREDLYGIKSAFITTSPRPVHCTKEGSNFDLVLKCKNEEGFTMTHFVIRGGSNCTAPIKDGLMWVSDTEPVLAEYSSKYNNYTAEQFHQLQRTGNPQEPIIFFTTEPPPVNEYQHEFREWVKGKYIHLKWLSCHMEGENIDIDYFAILGYEGKEHQTRALGPVPEELGITRIPFGAFNKLAGDYVRQLKSLPSLIVFTADPQVKAAVKRVAESSGHSATLNFFWAGNPIPDGIQSQVAEMIGIDSTLKEGESALCILNLKTNQKFVLETSEPITDAVVEKFVTQFLAGELKPKVKSAKRPEGDRDPEHPEITVVVADSFEELVLDPHHDVLLDVWAPWCGPCLFVAPIIAEVAHLLKDVPSIRIAKLDCDCNDTDREWLPETTIPNIKFFPRCAEGEKKKPIKYDGDRKVSAFLRFIHQHATEKFDLEKLTAVALKKEAVDEKKQTVGQKLARYLKAYNLCEQAGKHEEQWQSATQPAVDALKQALENDNITLEELQEAESKFDALEVVSQVLAKAQEIKDEKERLALKRVRKMHTDEEYEKLMAEYKEKDELVVVDFTATWCGPCQRIAPIFADFSEQYHPHVVFVKVDVDELEKSSAAAGVSAMPTFHFYKRGQKLEEVVGANTAKLQSLIQQLK